MGPRTQAEVITVATPGVKVAGTEVVAKGK